MKSFNARLIITNGEMTNIMSILSDKLNKIYEFIFELYFVF